MKSFSLNKRNKYFNPNVSHFTWLALAYLQIIAVPTEFKI